MKNYIFTAVLLFLTISLSAQPIPKYKDASQPIEVRVQDLLSRMTIEEKVAQLRHIHEGSILNDDHTLNLEKMKNIIGTLGWGAVEGLTLEGIEMARYTYQIQKHCIENTRLGIPIFTISESLHGAVQGGATIFPQAVALGSTFNPDLAYQMTKAISGELNAMGVNHVLSPTIDVIRELRWGRVEESFGEDPFLVSQMGVHEINGYIDGGISPMLKVFGPHGVPTSGLNLASTEANERDLREVFLKPYEVAVKQTGVNSVMTAYNSTNRIPNTASKWLLTDLLRTEWGFKGYTYSDWGAVSMLYGFHKVASNVNEAVKMALMAGTDLEASSDCYANIPAMVRLGELDVKYVDLACSRVLYAKFKAGLFENPYGLPIEEYEKKVRTKENVALSRRISEESVVMVKNEGNLLPLDMKKLKSVAVIGPNANQVQFGDYTWSRNNKDGITPLQGIQNLVGNKLAVHHAVGCDLVSDDKSGFADAVATAKKSDVVFLFVGSASASLARDYSNCTCGEGYDLTDLNLTGVQGDLVKEIYATGKPVVLILVTGRPFSITWEKEHIPAILFQWYGGEREGEVIADVLFGKVNPSGSLCYSIPQSVGHLPIHYNRLPSDKGIYRSPGTINKPGRDYVFSTPEPLWPFGYGLSYSDFEYSDFCFNKENYGLSYKPVKIVDTFQMLGEVDRDLADAMGVDCIGVGGTRDIFDHDTECMHEQVTPWGQKVLVPIQLDLTQDKEGDVYVYAGGDKNYPPSAVMPNGCFFINAIERQQPINEDKLNPMDNLEEFNSITDEELDAYKKKVNEASATGRAVVASFGGTALGDVAFVPGMGLKEPKGIRSVVEWYMSTVMRQEYLHEIFRRQTDIAIANYEKLWAVLGDKVDVVLTCGTDFGSQESQFCSVEVFNELWLPHYRRMNDWIHEHTTWKVFKHSCGAIVPILPGLIEAGFDIINPVQINAKDMDSGMLKREFGSHLTFWGGGVDTQKMLPFGTPDEIRRHVLGQCEILGKDGGFVFNSVHNIQANVPVENVIAMLDALKTV